jgi:preprotein translocase subunit SecB
MLASRRAGKTARSGPGRASGVKAMTMADNGNDGGNDGRPAAAQQTQSIGVIAQYVKDLSFESPAAPNSVRARSTAPTISIGVNVASRGLPGNELEVELRIEASAKEGDQTVFAIELSYGGLFKLNNVSQENVPLFAMIECPRLLFPFARQIIADASRNGGFPPLLIDPIDFVQLYRQRLAQMNAAQQRGATNA